MNSDYINIDDYIVDLEEISNIHKGLCNLLIQVIEALNVLVANGSKY